MMRTSFLIGIIVGVWLLAFVIAGGVRWMCSSYWVGSGNNIGSVRYAPHGCSETFHPIETVGHQGQPAPDISTIEPIRGGWYYDGVSVALLRYGNAVGVAAVIAALVVTTLMVLHVYQRRSVPAEDTPPEYP